MLPENRPPTVRKDDQDKDLYDNHYESDTSMDILDENVDPFTQTNNQKKDSLENTLNIALKVFSKHLRFVCMVQIKMK